MGIGIYRDFWGLGFPKIRNTTMVPPILRIIICWNLYRGPPIDGNYLVVLVASSFLNHGKQILFFPMHPPWVRMLWR